MKTFLQSTLLILIFIVPFGRGMSQTFSSSFSESPPTPDVLSPAPIIWWLGIEAGVNFNQHKGDFTTNDCRCTFSDGTGKGLIFGAELSHKLSDDFGIALKALYDDKRATYNLNFTAPRLTNEGTYTTLPLQRILNVQLSYLSINPMLEYFPFWGFYFMAGPSISLRLLATYDMEEKILDDNYVFNENGQNQQTIESTTNISSSQSIRLDLRAGLGYNIKLSRDVMFAPEVSFGYPLTKISDKDNWLAQSLHIVGVLKFSL